MADSKCEDRISSLPDHILIKILSDLPTKTSFETSVLSSRWRNIWQELPVLNLSDDCFRFDESDRFKHFRIFFYFVNSLIYVLKPHKVQKMRLSCTKSLTPDRLCAVAINAWIISAVGPLIKELDLTLYTIDNYRFNFPGHIYECSNLISISLQGSFKSRLVNYMNLPSVKKLGLGISGMDVATINAYLHVCPCVETLHLYLYVEDYIKICAPSLCIPSSLNSLKIIVNNSNIVTSLQTQLLLLDYLNISHDGKLQNAFLSASNASAFTLLSATKWLLGDFTHLHFPNFAHLLHLNLNFLLFNSNSIMSLLHNCHSLRVLIIQNDKEDCNDKECLQEQPSLSKWATQHRTPSCLESHLSFIQFKGNRGFTDELYFVKYILQKGRVLKKMRIIDISVDLKEKFHNLKRLSNVPRASTMCQLTFD